MADKHSNKVAVNLFGDKRQLQRNINNVFGFKDSQQNIAQMEGHSTLNLRASRRRAISTRYTLLPAKLTPDRPFIEVAINPGYNRRQSFLKFLKVTPVVVNMKTCQA